MIAPLILTVLCALVLGVWASRHLMIRRENRTGVVLTEAAPAPHETPRISVVVAAKDEEENIGRCIRTMLQQDYPNFEVIVVDDRSEDATADIVRGIASEDERVRLIQIEELPDGWCGKNNAMQIGIASTDAEYICMIDADCHQTSPRTLSVAMAYALQHRSDLLSVLPQLEMGSFWEHVIQPVCSGVMMVWFHPDKVNSPDYSNAYANGAFMLMRRDAYGKVGTHEAVKDKVNEDMHLALRTKQQGLRLRVVRSQGLYLVRMYTSLGQILRGWGRIFFGTFGTLGRLTVSTLVVLVMGLLPYATILAALVALLAAGPALWWGLALGAATAAVAMQQSVVYRFYGLCGAKKWLACTYALGCVMVLIALGRALANLRPGAKVTWRNTSYVHGN